MRLKETTIVRDFKRSHHKPVLSKYTPTDAYCEISYQLLQYMFNDAWGYPEYDFIINEQRPPCHLAYAFIACLPYFKMPDFSIVMFNRSTRNPSDRDWETYTKEELQEVFDKDLNNAIGKARTLMENNGVTDLPTTAQHTITEMVFQLGPPRS